MELISLSLVSSTEMVLPVVAVGSSETVSRPSLTKIMAPDPYVRGSKIIANTANAIVAKKTKAAGSQWFLKASINVSRENDLKRSGSTITSTYLEARKSNTELQY